MMSFAALLRKLDFFNIASQTKDKAPESEANIECCVYRVPFYEERSVDVTLHKISAKFYLNKPLEEIVPEKYLKRAAESSLLKNDPWVFTQGVEDARNVNLANWDKNNLEWCGVFKTLKKVPELRFGLYENMMNKDWTPFYNQDPKVQGQVVYGLLLEILNKETITAQAGRNNIFYLDPKLAPRKMIYRTGYCKKFDDAPKTAGSYAIDFHPSTGYSESIVPICNTMKPDPIKDTFATKFKIILGQLDINIRVEKKVPGDKFPDQEVYLIGMHGSRLHIMRAIFPGKKTGKIWCGNGEARPRQRRDIPARPTNEEIPGMLQDINGILRSPDFGEELLANKFNVLCTREYDLWKKGDFREAMRALLAMNMYLMSGEAQNGVMQCIFDMFPQDDEKNKKREKKKEKKKGDEGDKKKEDDEGDKKKKKEKKKKGDEEGDKKKEKKKKKKQKQKKKDGKDGAPAVEEEAIQKPGEGEVAKAAEEPVVGDQEGSKKKDQEGEERQGVRDVKQGSQKAKGQNGEVLG